MPNKEGKARGGESHGREVRFRDGSGRRVSVPVTDEVLEAYLGGLNADQNQRKRDYRHGVFSYNAGRRAVDGERFELSELLLADFSTEPEHMLDQAHELALHELMLDILYESLDALKDLERDLVVALYFEEKSVKQYSQEQFVTIYAIYKRKKRAIDKLRAIVRHELQSLDPKTYGVAGLLLTFATQV